MRSLVIGGLALLTLAQAQVPGPDTEAEARFRLLRQYRVYRGARTAESIMAEWTDAVDRHLPGEADDAAARISRWTGDELDYLLTRCLFLLTATERERFDLHLPARGRVLERLKRGALLHADIALLFSADELPRGIVLRTSPKKYYLVEHFDGRAAGGFASGVHLEIGRALLSFLSHMKLGDAAYESLWYRATAAVLAQEDRNGEAEPHLRAAIEESPRDARLLFYAAALHEVYAAPRTQRALDQSVLPSGYVPAAGDAREELQRAEKLLERSLKAMPDDLEVRLHHGRVLGQLGRHADAAGELALVDGKLKDPDLAYYAALFRGQEEGALGRRDAARDAFERAAALFPSAQSPLLGLSSLARRYGDRSGAVAALRRLLALPRDEAERPDPWWRYAESHVRDADALLSELRARFSPEATP